LELYHKYADQLMRSGAKPTDVFSKERNSAFDAKTQKNKQLGTINKCGQHSRTVKLNIETGTTSVVRLAMPVKVSPS
jgi:glutamyl/glutaminyl-tRNA synthetase